MKPNSCLYRAVRDVIAFQFGVTDLKSDVFDKYNSGDGVKISEMSTVINEALMDYGIVVSGIFGNISDPESLDDPSLFSKCDFIPAPCVAIDHDDQHAIPVLPGTFVNANIGVLLERAK